MLNIPHGYKKSTAGSARPKKSKANTGADRSHEAPRGNEHQSERQTDQEKLRAYAQAHSTSAAQATFAAEEKAKQRH